MSRLAGATCLAALLLAPPAPGAAAEPPASATAVLEPAVIGVGELASFTITVTSGGFGGIDAQPAFELDNLEVAGGPSQSHSQSWVNGKTSSKLQLTWRLRPKGVGPARVRSIALTVAGQALRLSDKEIEVRQEPPPRPQPAPGQPGAPGARSFDPFEDLFGRAGAGRRRNPSAAEIARPKVYLRAELQPAAVYAGQQMTYTLWLYTQTDVGAYQPTRLPAFKGFWVREIPQPAELKPDWLEPNGERIARFAILRRALFPLQAGRFPIEAAEVDLVARMAEIGPFGTPFGRSETLHLKTEPIALEVLALPPSPPGFTGAVGDLTVSARLDRSTIAVGEAATLTIRSTGNGNLQSLRAPQLPIPDGIRTFPPRQESAERLTDGSLVSSQEWSYVLVAERPGSFEVPALALPYFDPAKREFRQASTRPLRLAVTGDSATAAAPPPAAPPEPSPAAATEPAPAPRSGRIWLWAAGGGLLVAGLLGGAALGRTHRTSRSRGTGRPLASALRAIEASATKATPRETAAEIEEALRAHLEARFEIAPGTPVSHWHALLTAARVDPATATEVAELTRELHYLRYAPELAAADELRSDALSRARRLARALR